MGTASNLPHLIDTGPLLALLDRRDRHHEWIAERLSRTTEALRTCEAVVSEALFVLKRQRVVWDPLLQLLELGLLVVEPLYEDQHRLIALLRKYADLPTSYADAGLVVLSERHGHFPLLTTDSDFRIYRRKDRTMVPVEMP